MEREIIIRPLGLVKGSTVLPGSSIDKDSKRTYHLLDNGEISLDDVPAGRKVKHIVFDTDGDLSYKFKFDDKGEGPENQARRKEYDFWRKHMLVKAKDNKNLTKELFILEDLVEETDQKIEKIKLKAKVYSIVSDGSIQDMYNYAYWVGINPRGVTPSNLFVKLLDFNTGELMKTEAPHGEIPAAIKFLENLGKEDMSMRIVFEKAIKFGIINEVKKGVVTSFMVGTEQIGSDREQAFTYLKTNSEFYKSFVIPQVAEHDGKDIKGSDQLVKDAVAKVNKPVTGEKKKVENFPVV